MLICNNCFTVNEDGVESCRHCNMKGNFSHQDDEGKAGDPMEPEDHIVQCRNCGHDTPADARQCAECHFPLPARMAGGKIESNPPVWRSLRAG
ncbi:MAG: hypothetical protein J5I98_12740 [Phaeodactylibacter sp.]|nr:hypothetical protein [Phaeodactylibacter sp.]